MIARLFRYAMVLAASIPLLSFPADAQTRHALVVGIDNYANVTPLQKARNDAQAVNAALQAAGFETRLVLDPDRRALLSAFASFSESLRPGDEAVFYFAGHGVEVGGRNILLAADIPALSPSEAVLLESEGLPVDRVLAALQERGARASVLIIDACRNNPFPDDGIGRSLGATRGLARIQPPSGAMVVFSAGAGQEALDRLSNDDPDPNSVFTRKLLPLLSTPGLPMHEAARRLRGQVEDLALRIDHRQRPAIYDEMRGDFVLVPAAVATQPIAQTPTPAEDPCAAALPIWAAIQSIESVAALEAFAANYEKACPALAVLAQERLATLTTTESAAPKPALAITPAPVTTADVDWTRVSQVMLSAYTSSLWSAAFSPDGRRVVTASWDKTARILDASTGRVIVTLRGHTKGVFSAAFSPDGQRIVTASADRTARIWDAGTGREIATLKGHMSEVKDADFSPDGKHIVTASRDRTARIWDAGTGREIATLKGTLMLNSAAYSPDGQQIVFATSEKIAHVWDSGTGRVIATLSGHTSAVHSAVFSPDGQRIVTAAEDNTARIWDSGSGREIATLNGHTRAVSSAAFSPDGRRIVTASADTTARIWDSGTGREIAVLKLDNTNWGRGAAFSPDGQRILTLTNKSVRVWSAP